MPDTRLYKVYHRTWYEKSEESITGRIPHFGPEIIIEPQVRGLKAARALARKWDTENDAGPLHDRAGFRALVCPPRLD